MDASIVAVFPLAVSSAVLAVVCLLPAIHRVLPLVRSRRTAISLPQPQWKKWGFRLICCQFVSRIAS